MAGHAGGVLAPLRPSTLLHFLLQNKYFILVVKMLSFIFNSRIHTHSYLSFMAHIDFLIPSLPSPTHPPPLGLPTRLSLLSTLPLPAKKARHDAGGLGSASPTALAKCHTRFSEKTNYLTICMPRSSFIHIVTS
jgi:hypothetical protein